MAKCSLGSEGGWKAFETGRSICLAFGLQSDFVLHSCTVGLRMRPSLRQRPPQAAHNFDGFVGSCKQVSTRRTPLRASQQPLLRASEACSKATKPRNDWYSRYSILRNQEKGALLRWERLLWKRTRGRTSRISHASGPCRCLPEPHRCLSWHFRRLQQPLHWPQSRSALPHNVPASNQDHIVLHKTDCYI